MKFIGEFITILLISVGMALVTHSCHHASGGGRLICDPAKLPEGQVCLDKVINEWDGDVVWVDARTEAEWEKRTIPGALCLNPGATPDRWDQLVADAMPKLLPASAAGKPIVIFCQSANCGASDQVADELRDPNSYGLQEVYVLFNGWKAIQRYPYAKLLE